MENQHSTEKGKEIKREVSSNPHTDRRNEAPTVEGNTIMFYLYRDAGNYKTENRVVLKGSISAEQKRTILDARSEGLYFIPMQVGLPEERDYEPNPQEDHVWFELDNCAFELTTKAPTVSLSVSELASNFEKAAGAWDETKAYQRLFGETPLISRTVSASEKSPF